MTHIHSLIWSLPLLIQGSISPPPAHTPSPTDGYNQPVVHLLSMKRHGSSIEHMNHLLPVVVQNSILYMLVQLNQSSLEGKQNVQ